MRAFMTVLALSLGLAAGAAAVARAAEPALPLIRDLGRFTVAVRVDGADPFLSLDLIGRFAALVEILFR